MTTDSLSISEQILGISSFLYESEAENVINVTNYGITGFTFFKVLIILLLVYYVSVVSMKKCSKLLSKTLKLKYVSEELFENSSLVSDKFLLRCKQVWVVCSGVLIYKIIDLLIGGHLTHLPYIYLLVLPLMFVFPFIFSLEKLVLKLSAALTFNEELISKLLYLNNLFLSTSAILLAPMIILSALYSGRLLIILAILGVFLAVLLLILWLFKTYMLFVEKKVSSLNWFLYLCTVEIFPLTLILYLISIFYKLYSS